MTDTIAPIEAIPDFGGTAVRQPKPFKIDGEVFYVAGSQPASILFEMADLANQQDFSAQVKMIMRLLEGTLIPESYERFVQRMKSQTNPITIEQIMQILRWTMEQYADRPTQPAVSFSAPQDSVGISSTAGAPSTP